MFVHTYAHTFVPTYVRTDVLTYLCIYARTYEGKVKGKGVEPEGKTVSNSCGKHISRGKQAAILAARI